MQETWVPSLGQKDPLEEKMATCSSILPGKSRGQKSLAGCSPHGHKELDMAERLTVSMSTKYYYDLLHLTDEDCETSIEVFDCHFTYVRASAVTTGPSFCF